MSKHLLNLKDASWRRRALTIIAPSVTFLSLTALCVILFWRPGTFYKQPNAGHRLGGDVFEEFPENTLALFRKSIPELEHQPDYLYSECDLRETLDHHTVIFHDWDLSRLVPDTSENRAVLGGQKVGKQKIRELTLEQVKSLKLHGGHSIPSLEELLDCAKELRLQKPLILEIKHFHSSKGRKRMLVTVEKFRDQVDFPVNFLAFRRNLNRSHPKPKMWLRVFSDKNFRVYQVYRPKTSEYDLCNNW